MNGEISQNREICKTFNYEFDDEFNDEFNDFELEPGVKVIGRRSYKLLKSKASLLNAIRQQGMEERGSISVLIIGLFTIALLLSVGIMNVSESYIAKRQLVQIGEEVVQRASHLLDYSQYYLADQSWIATSRIPLNCDAVHVEVSQAISNSKLQGRPIRISSFDCKDGLVRVGLHAEILPLIQYPLFESVSGANISIGAEVESGTYLGQSD